MRAKNNFHDKMYFYLSFFLFIFFGNAVGRQVNLKNHNH